MEIPILKIDAEKSDVEYANDFLAQLKNGIEASPCDPAKGPIASQLAVRTCVQVWGLLTSMESSTFMVQNDPEHGDGNYELLSNAFYDDFSEVMEDPSSITNEQIQMTSPVNCALSFLRILAVQVLNFTPNTTEDIVTQLVRQVANTFNGNNRFHIAFELIGYKGDTDEGPEFTGNLSNLLLVSSTPFIK